MARDQQSATDERKNREAEEHAAWCQQRGRDRCYRLARVGPQAVQVYCAITAFVDNIMGFSSVSLDEVATLLNLTRRAVDQSVTRLVQLGFLDIEYNNGEPRGFWIQTWFPE